MYSVTAHAGPDGGEAGHKAGWVGPARWWTVSRGGVVVPPPSLSPLSQQAGLRELQTKAVESHWNNCRNNSCKISAAASAGAGRRLEQQREECHGQTPGLTGPPRHTYSFPSLITLFSSLLLFSYHGTLCSLLGTRFPAAVLQGTVVIAVSLLASCHHSANLIYSPPFVSVLRCLVRMDLSR